jgi:hypothetical protein
VRIAIALVIALALVACASDQDRAVEDAARSFAQALRSGDVDRACTGLAPATLEELEESTGQQCTRALPEQDLVVLDRVDRVERYGRQGSVEVSSSDGETDTWFLSRFDGRWLVVAASCVPRPQQPYDCDVEGL